LVVALAVAVGFLAGRISWLLLRPVLGGESFARENYRGRLVPTAAGLAVAVAGLGVESVRAIISATANESTLVAPARQGALLVAVGLAFVGFLDDLVGDSDRRGFRGHARALLTGQLTTGGLKLFGGAAVAVVAVAISRPDPGVAQLLVDAALIALAANLANLLDRAPGRAIKVGLVAFLVLAAVFRVAPELVGPAVLVGAALALLRDDLHERLMLGDTGANLLGGVLGLATVLTATPTARLATLVCLAALNVLSEWVSFSRVIDAVPPLRILDRAGRRAE
jgi:UDP-N-acetylmuramyl pentapeptide phosphotransferase/UDP-N-acetylglucosamine-1-phosphate transferase